MNPWSRRDILKGTLAGTLSAMGASSFLQNASADLPKDKKVRIAVVGGGFGLCYFWHLHPNSCVTAITDLFEDRRQKLKDRYQCDAVFPSMETMLEEATDSFDAVAVFTPAPDHARHVIACLNKGKHVICAVPAAMKLEECEAIRDAVEKNGKHYMMAETSYYRPSCIAAREMARNGEFGKIIYTEAEYHHPRSPNAPYKDQRIDPWRWGLPPMLYPTHCTAFLVGVTGERLTEVTCIGHPSDDPALKDNPYDNPFYNEAAFFKTSTDGSMRVAVFWTGAIAFCERGQWIGEKKSFYDKSPDMAGYMQRETVIRKESNPDRFVYGHVKTDPWEKPDYNARLPQTLAEGFGQYHDGAEVFLTHEFVSAILEDRKPAINVYEALAMTAPGIVAHKSALQSGVQLKVPQFDR